MPADTTSRYLKDAKTLQHHYEEMASDIEEVGVSLRKCEQGVMRLIDYETDWLGLRNAMSMTGMDDAAVDAYLRTMVSAGMDRARRAVSSLTDESYERIKRRYRIMHGYDDDCDTSFDE